MRYFENKIVFKVVIGTINIKNYYLDIFKNKLTYISY